MATQMGLSSGGHMARFLALLIFAGTASAGQAAGVGGAGSALRLPTAAGNAVAEVLYTPALDFGTLGVDDFGPSFPWVMPDDQNGERSWLEWRDTKLGDGGYRARRDWRFSGSLAQEDVILGTTEWRVGAWVSREF